MLLISRGIESGDAPPMFTPAFTSSSQPLRSPSSVALGVFCACAVAATNASSVVAAALAIMFVVFIVFSLSVGFICIRVPFRLRRACCPLRR